MTRTSRSASAASKAFRLSKRREMACLNVVRVLACTAAAKSISSAWIKNLRATVLRQTLRDALNVKKQALMSKKQGYSYGKRGLFI